MGRPVSKPTKSANIRFRGPLSPFVGELEARLRRAGYTPLSTASFLRLVAHLSRWLEANGLGSCDLGPATVECYLAARREEGRVFALTAASLAPLVAMLAEKGLLPRADPPTPLSPDKALLASFAHYLHDERGLAPSTVGAYVLRVGRFLDWSGGRSGLAVLGVEEITSAVLREAGVSVGSGQHFVAALRAFLRYLYLEGLIGRDLSTAALAVTGRRRSSLPTGITRADADTLLAACDRRRNVGRRDFAVLTVLLRLGLRASEVAGLSLDDVDWRVGEITVSGKGGRIDRLPLPGDVGEAIAAYLQRGRPDCGHRELFLRAVAPVGPIGRGGVSSIVRHGCARAGLPEVGAHRLRHSVASQLLTAGAPLEEIGQLLRHRSILSTANYARIDLVSLRKLAQPWPGSLR